MTFLFTGINLKLVSENNELKKLLTISQGQQQYNKEYIFIMDWRERELFKVIEHEDQKKIVKCLREEFGCLVFDLDVMSALSFIKDEKDKMRFINEHKARGYTNGQPDLVIVTPIGKILFVEIKTKNGMQSQSQKEVEAWLLENGQYYKVWRSVDDCYTIKDIDK